MAVTQAGRPYQGCASLDDQVHPGFAAPLHHHTADHFVTVIAATLVLNVDGQDHRLPAGSFFSFTGKKSHTTKCEPGAECVLANDARGKWDVVPDREAAR
jgi:quercetin dioxygenase-like cupin family protein